MIVSYEVMKQQWVKVWGFVAYASICWISRNELIRR